MNITIVAIKNGGTKNKNTGAIMMPATINKIVAAIKLNVYQVFLFDIIILV